MVVRFGWYGTVVTRRLFIGGFRGLDWEGLEGPEVLRGFERFGGANATVRGLRLWWRLFLRYKKVSSCLLLVADGI